MCFFSQSFNYYCQTFLKQIFTPWYFSQKSFSIFGWWREWNSLQICRYMHRLKKMLKGIKVKPISLMKLWKTWKKILQELNSHNQAMKQTLDSSLFHGFHHRVVHNFRSFNSSLHLQGLCVAFLIIVGMKLLMILSNTGNVYTESKKLWKLLHRIQPTFNVNNKTKLHVIRSIYRTSGYISWNLPIGFKVGESITSSCDSNIFSFSNH